MFLSHHYNDNIVESLIDRIRWRITMGYGPAHIATEFGQYHSQEIVYLAYTAAKILIDKAGIV